MQLLKLKALHNIEKQETFNMYMRKKNSTFSIAILRYVPENVDKVRVFGSVAVPRGLLVHGGGRVPACSKRRVSFYSPPQSKSCMLKRNLSLKSKILTCIRQQNYYYYIINSYC